MTQNLTPLERDVRGAILAPVAFLFMLAVGFTSVAGILAFVAVIGLLITAFTGYCPVYDVFEIDRTQTTAR